jgi:Tfp pilus assembly protein PilO
MKDLPKILLKYQRLVQPILLIISLLVFYQFLLPKFNQVKGQYEANEKARKQKEALQAKIQDLQSLNEYELSEKSELLLLALPAGKDVAGKMSLVSKITEESGLVVESLKISPGEVATQSAEKKEVDELVFKLTLSGEINQFIDFLENASEFLPLMGVTDINIELANNSQATINCTLKSYYADLPASLGKVDSPVPKLTAQEETLLEELRKYSSYETEIFEPMPGGKANPFTF